MPSPTPPAQSFPKSGPTQKHHYARFRAFLPARCRPWAGLRGVVIQGLPGDPRAAVEVQEEDSTDDLIQNEEAWARLSVSASESSR